MPLGRALGRALPQGLLARGVSPSPPPLVPGSTPGDGLYLKRAAAAPRSPPRLPSPPRRRTGPVEGGGVVGGKLGGGGRRAHNHLVSEQYPPRGGGFAADRPVSRGCYPVARLAPARQHRFPGAPGTREPKKREVPAIWSCRRPPPVARPRERAGFLRWAPSGGSLAPTVAADIPYAGAGTRLVLQLFLGEGFKIPPLQLPNHEGPVLLYSVTSSGVNPLGTLRACCLP